MNDVAGKAKRLAGAAAGATISEILTAALDGAPTVQGAEQPAADAGTPAGAENAAGHREWVPETETTTIHHNPDGSVDASTGTTWRPEGTKPGDDVPTVETSMEIEVHEDEHGNFVIDAVEHIVVHNHGHDQVFEDHQHLVVPGDGTPGDTDLDIIEREDIVVHENPDGSVWVERQDGGLLVETHPDAPGHGDIEVWQVETVTLDEAPTGPAGIRVGITEDEQAHLDEPFGEPAGSSLHQIEVVGDRTRTGAVTVTTTPSTVAPPAAFSASATETQNLAASTTFGDRANPQRHTEEHPSFFTHPPVKEHDPGELTGPRPLPEIQPQHPEVPKTTVEDVPPHHIEEEPPPDLPAHEQNHDRPDEAHHPLDVPDHEPTSPGHPGVEA